MDTLPQELRVYILALHCRDVSSADTWVDLAIRDKKLARFTRKSALLTFVDLATKITDLPGGKTYMLFGRLHRCRDLPAVEGKDYKLWWKNGKLHRVGNPAYIHDHGKTTESKYYYKHRLHREDGPAVEYLGKTFTTQDWYRNGKLHRDGGPAVIAQYGNGRNNYQKWYQNGVLHREDGPAYESGNCQEWRVHGKLHRIDGPAKSYPNHTEWRVHGKLHRIDGPAKIKNKTEYWYLNGKKHRVGGPAIEHKNYQSWYCKGKLHRTDGPAIIGKQKTTTWYHKGILITNDYSIKWPL